MKKPVYIHRVLITAALILLCTIIQQELEAGFHVTTVQKSIGQYKVTGKKLLPDDNFLVKVLFRFVSIEEKEQHFSCR